MKKRVGNKKGGHKFERITEVGQWRVWMEYWNNITVADGVVFIEKYTYENWHGSMYQVSETIVSDASLWQVVEYCKENNIPAEPYLDFINEQVKKYYSIISEQCEHEQVESMDVGGTDEMIGVCHDCGAEV